jgi:hypothetical protein
MPIDALSSVGYMTLIRNRKTKNMLFERSGPRTQWPAPSAKDNPMEPRYPLHLHPFFTNARASIISVS